MKHRNTRRRFIRQIATTTAALSVAPSLFVPRLKKERLGVALVGLGYYSTEILAPALQRTKHCYLAGIVTGTPQKAVEWQKKYNLPDNCIYNYQNFGQIANNPAIDVVYVVLPNAMHREFTLRAAAAGKHVWCEKPMAMNEAECRDMVDACAKNKVVLTIGYRMQHEPNTQQAIRYCREKKAGKVQMITVNAGFREWRKNHWHLNKALGGGAMYDMGVYPLNAARYIAGEEPMAVTATQKIHRPDLFVDVDETMLFQLEFPSGVVASCATSLGMNMKNHMTVVCEKGWLRMEPFSDYNGVQGFTDKGEKWDQLISEAPPLQQLRQMDDDALAILENKAVLVPGEEGMRDIRVLDAIYRSAREGKRVTI
jgi:glucose-fructose oxidoreductase